MKKFKFEFEVDDDFKIGCCFDCPLHVWIEYDDDGYCDEHIGCTVGYSYTECPLKEVKSVEITR